MPKIDKFFIEVRNGSGEGIFTVLAPKEIIVASFLMMKSKIIIATRVKVLRLLVIT